MNCPVDRTVDRSVRAENAKRLESLLSSRFVDPVRVAWQRQPPRFAIICCIMPAISCDFFSLA